MKWFWFTSLVNSDYFILARFLIPLAFTDVAVDIGEQFLNSSVSRAANVQGTLAAFGLAYVLVKFFVGILQEVKQVGVVLVHDRPGFHKILVSVLVMGVSIFIILVLIAKTQLGVWLIEDLHGVTCTVANLTHQALLYFSVYPLIDVVSWYHGGVLLQWRHSTLVGVASFADIMAQIFSVAILLYSPLVCRTPIVVPILAAYGGIITRCTITLVGFYRLVYPKLKKETVEKVTVWRLVTFVSPLMFVVGVQRFTRPLINLLVTKFSPTKSAAEEALAVLTATYPLGHIAYGWINQVRPIPPAFQQKSPSAKDRPIISGKKIAFFIIGALCVSIVISILLFWVPGVSVAILEHAVGIPHELALKCIDPLRVFSFFCFTVAVRSSLTGWLTLHRQTKLVTPRGFFRVGSVVAVFFSLHAFGISGALLGVLSLLSGFVAEMIVMTVMASIYACWRQWKRRRTGGMRTIGSELSSAPLGDGTAALSGEQTDIELVSLLKVEQEQLNCKEEVALTTNLDQPEFSKLASEVTN